MRQLFRPLVTARRTSGEVETWRCDHDHRTIPAAALCGQLAMRAMTPNTRAKVVQVRFESVSQQIFVRNNNTGGLWMSLESYRDTHGDISA